MKALAKVLSISLIALFVPMQNANANNPFPGVAFGAEIPGLSKTITCTETPQIPDDCVRQGGGQVSCPAGSANDITPSLRPDGSWASLKSWCRNSWTPPTSAADDEDFRNRQALAVAAATVESQAYSAANPGLQKCVTWGPIVHANGISTASGGVCANVVGTKSDGTTAQVAPTPVSSGSSGTTAQVAPTPVNSGSSGTGSSGSSTTSPESTTSTSSTPAAQQPARPQVDLTQFGIGRPFTRVVAGNLSASQCPSGYQAATNSLSGIIDGGATECWPANAWAAYSVGGDVWAKFKSTNGSINAEAEASRRIQVNALRALALQQSQQLANQTIGIKRCASWSGFGESGQECAYIPVQNNTIGGVIISASDTSTTQIKSATEVVVAKLASEPGQSQADWEKSESYTAFVCPGGSGKSLSLDLNGTTSKLDDVWTLTCVQVSESNNSPETTTVGLPSETSTIVLPIPSETITAVSQQDSLTIDLRLAETQTVISADAIQFRGSIAQVREVVLSLQLPDLESNAFTGSLGRLTNIKSISKASKVRLPNSSELIEVAKSLTPLVCKVSGLTIRSKKNGVCRISYSLEGKSGNIVETVKKITFRK